MNNYKFNFKENGDFVQAYASIVINDKNLICVTYQIKLIKQILEVYGDLLFMDSTCNFADRGDNQNWKDWSILMVNEIESTEVGCLFVVMNMTIEVLISIFEFLASRNDFEKCESFMTDKDIKEKKVFLSFLIDINRFV